MAADHSMGPEDAKKKFSQADKMFAFSSTTLSSQADDLTKALTTLALKMANSGNYGYKYDMNAILCIYAMPCHTHSL